MSAATIDAMWVKGSGFRPGDDEDENTSLRSASRRHCPLLERDEMSDEEMVAHLARCPIDPAAPRSSIETLLHAFIPAPHVHHTHPDGHQCAGRDQRRRAVGGRVLRRSGNMDSVHPTRVHARQAGRARRSREPAPQARCAGEAWSGRLGRHRRGGIQAHDRSDQPGRHFANAKTAGEERFDGPLDAQAVDRHAVLLEVLPALRGAVSSERHKVLVVDTSPRVLEFVSANAAPH